MAVGILTRILVLGAVYSGVWALVSSGFTLVFGVGRILNFSHGIFFVLGAYMTYTFYSIVGINLWLSFLLGILFVGGVGFFIQKAFIEKLEEMEMIIIVTLAFALFVDRVIIRLFSELPKTLPSFIGGRVTFAGVSISWMSVLVLFSALAILVLLHLFINKTRIGAAIDATAQDAEASRLMGVNVDNILLLTMSLSGILAAIAGIFYCQLYTITPEIGIIVLLFAFAIVILGGMGSVKGSILGAFIVGYIVTATIQFWGVRYAYIVTLLIIVATLIVKPSGLFGKEGRA